ncbi:UNVERIFIED_CONTAM: Tudor domain-containing protein 3 [Sesamum radiatum]|uniref:Tudor domain-containing protein 3 n=1 Tax=Sesamum radiatum TaxID=300843 RepID=A0AAW2NAB3_SESRA
MCFCNQGRLLRLELTDGHSRITVVEYPHVPSIPEDVIPGTKVQLRNKAYIRSGILCLNEKVIAILGGVVQSLYEEWKLKRKYLDVSRHTLGLSQENASSCPPPFEKLEIRARVQGTGATKGKYCPSGTTEFSGSASNEIRQSQAAKGECSSLSRTSGLQKINASVDSATNDIKVLHTVGENKDNQTCSSARSKGVA